MGDSLVPLLGYHFDNWMGIRGVVPVQSLPTVVIQMGKADQGREMALFGLVSPPHPAQRYCFQVGQPGHSAALIQLVPEMEVGGINYILVRLLVTFLFGSKQHNSLLDELKTGEKGILVQCIVATKSQTTPLTRRPMSTFLVFSRHHVWVPALHNFIF